MSYLTNTKQNLIDKDVMIAPERNSEKTYDISKVFKLGFLFLICYIPFMTV